MDTATYTINETTNVVEGPLERQVEILGRNAPIELMAYGKTYMFMYRTYMIGLRN